MVSLELHQKLGFSFSASLFQREFETINRWLRTNFIRKVVPNNFEFYFVLNMNHSSIENFLALVEIVDLESFTCNFFSTVKVNQFPAYFWRAASTVSFLGSVMVVDESCCSSMDLVYLVRAIRFTPDYNAVEGR